MSTVSEPSISASAEALRPIISPRYGLAWRHLALALPFAALFLLVNHLPLRPTDLWSHVSFGNWIVAKRALPSEDPFQPLAEGMPIVDTAWLSQVIFAEIDRLGGPLWLANAFSVVVLLTFVLLARALYLQTGRLGLTVGGTLLALLLGASRLTTIRPEIFGVLCFAAVIWLLSSRREARGQQVDDSALAGPFVTPRSWFAWLSIVGVFALWANLHGSFPSGLLLLACCGLGRAIQVGWQTRSLRAIVTDRESGRWLILGELALAATLVNPYGIDLWFYVVELGRHPCFQQITEWQPLVVLGTAGREFALSWILLLIVWRYGRKPVHPSEVLLLAVFGAMAVLHIRMIAWYAPIAAIVIARHAADMLLRTDARRASLAQWLRASEGMTRVQEQESDLPARRPSWIPTLACALVVWTAFSLSGFGQALLGGKPRTAEKTYDRQTPLGVAEYFREHPPVGQVFNPQPWGDWLVYAGPPGLDVFMMSHMHHVPPQVWNDYLQIYAAQPAWYQTLDRYAVNTVVVDKQHQRALEALLGSAPDWQMVYDDAQATVFQRRAKPSSIELKAQMAQVAAASH